MVKNLGRVFVTEDMVGHKLGEFSFTRTFKGHTQVKKEEALANNLRAGCRTMSRG